MANEHTDSEEKELGDVYRERNLLAVAYIQQYRGTDCDIGWWPDESLNGEEFAVVWANTPEGQVGWHVGKDMVPAWVPKRDPEYDGYTTNEKNRRVAHRTGLVDEDGTPQPTVATEEVSE